MHTHIQAHAITCTRRRLCACVQVDACVAKVNCEAATGGKDEAWGGRAHVLYDFAPVSARSTARRQATPTIP